MYTRNDGHIIVNQLCESEGESLSHVRLCHPMNYIVYSSWNSPGQNRGVGSLSLLQGIFTTQESNWGLLHCRRILYQLSYQNSPLISCESESKSRSVLSDSLQPHQL